MRERHDRHCIHAYGGSSKSFDEDLSQSTVPDDRGLTPSAQQMWDLLIVSLVWSPHPEHLASRPCPLLLARSLGCPLPFV